MGIITYGKVICEGGKPVMVTDFRFTEPSLYKGSIEALTWAKHCIVEALIENESLLKKEGLRLFGTSGKRQRGENPVTRPA